MKVRKSAQASTEPTRASIRRPPLRTRASEPRRVHPLCPLANAGVGPRQRSVVDIVEERRVGAQRREVLEEQREVALSPRTCRREVFDRAVTFSSRAASSRRCPRCRDSRRLRRRRARGSPESARGSTPNFSRTPSASRIFFRCADRSARRGLRARIAQDPCPASRCATFSTRSSADARCAAEASASSASSSTIGQTTTPIAASASSSG